MLDLSRAMHNWNMHNDVPVSTTHQRVLVLVDRSSADGGLLAKLAPPSEEPPATILWLWVVTPGAIVSWGALLVESGDRTAMMLSALGERMEEARRFMTPLQSCSRAANIPCETHILHGAVADSVVRLARLEQSEQVLLATTDGTIYGQPAQELASELAQRLPVAVSILA